MESAQRRLESEDFISSMPSAAPVGMGAPPVGDGGGAGQGKRPSKSPDWYDQQLNKSVDGAMADLKAKGIPLGAGATGYDGRPSGKLSAFLKSVASQESGGNYKAVGVPTRSGTAYGKYQILDSNFKNPGGWDKEALGRDITVQQYLNHPKWQEKIARSKLTQYYKQYGAGGAAKAWYAGPGNANTNSNSPQYGGPSINAYAAQVLSRMKNYL